MSAPLNRRAALGAFASVPALAILPVALANANSAFANSVHPDADLLAMQPAIDAADRELQAAFDALNPIEDAYYLMRPDPPEELKEGLFSPEQQRGLDAFAAKTRETREKISPAWAAYNQAVEDYHREIELLKIECGVTAAEEVRDGAQWAISQLQADMIDAPAKTLAGLIFKARYAATHYSDEYDKEVMESIVDDLLAMADELAEA
jgi:hypothetical protein